MEQYRKDELLKALKVSGLPYTAPNFIYKYEHLKCKEHNKPFLVSKWDSKPGMKSIKTIKWRVYSEEDIKGIVRVAKEGWFTKDWHWPPLDEKN